MAPRASAAPRPREDPAYECHASSRGAQWQLLALAILAGHYIRWWWFLTRVDVLQALQIPPDGLRDGYLGNDVANHRAKEGVQIHVLSCESGPLILRAPMYIMLIEFTSETYGFFGVFLSSSTALRSPGIKQ